MRQWMIDAFASEPFKGNPACVVEPLDVWPSDAWMHSLAAENNQAETAFLLRTADPARFGLRWRTPAIEVPLCGHATLGSSHALFAELGLAAEAITFDTLSGSLIVRRTADGYEMDFPSKPPRRIDPPAGLAEALGATPKEVWSAAILVAVLDDETTVRGLKPDFAAIQRIASDASEGPGNVGVVALADAGRPYEVVDRFFAPGSGIPEDPTTGGMHCTLAPLFADRLGKATIRFHQAYPGRGGDLECEVRGDRVLLRGAAVTVLESRLRL
ncbi:MAG TPA: PhzF family phenazine biosynthesis protein [Caulobacteraceae bacterium]|jgi:PhzF family phenazine biosynthesis protein|nr:PhzF family phenazine biosynthesis protein [Caulobacteraceae bacterium]